MKVDMPLNKRKKKTYAKVYLMIKKSLRSPLFMVIGVLSLLNLSISWMHVLNKQWSAFCLRQKRDLNHSSNSMRLMCVCVCVCVCVCRKRVFEETDLSYSFGVIPLLVKLQVKHLQPSPSSNWSYVSTLVVICTSRRKWRINSTAGFSLKS